MKETKRDDIELEASLLNALSTKKNYEKFISVLDTKRLIPITASLLKDYDKYYAKYKEDINFETFYTEFSQNWHKKDLDEGDLAYYREVVFPLVQKSVATNNTYISLLEREAAHKIEQSMHNFNEQEIEEIVAEFKKLRNGYTEGVQDSDIFTINDLDLSVLDNSNGLTWFLPGLQAGVGSHMPGQFWVVAADSDTGKSAFCISQAVHVFKQLNKQGSKRPILYCTSEDTKEDLACRFLSNLYSDKVHGGFEDIINQYEKVGKNFETNFKADLFLGVAIRGHADLHNIKSKIAKYNPSLIIIDMLDKLSSSDNIQDLTRLYQDIRGIANDGYPIIGTSQSGNTSYQDKETGEFKHRRWLTDKDLANSKSGKQGAAYGMLMVGRDDDVPNIRYISTTKKKRGRSVDLTCEIVNEYSLYRQLL